MRKLTTEEFIAHARVVHGQKYDYSCSEYHGWNKKVNIMCPNHGMFSQVVNVHISMRGNCPKCGNESRGRSAAKKLTLTTSKFIEECIAVHGDRYDYSMVDYKGALRPVSIVCKKHGQFTQRASDHKRGANCPFCHISVSKVCSKWLDLLSIPVGWREVRVGKFLVDAFDSENNTIYEFYGDFWHGNPDIYQSGFYNKMTKTTMGYLFERTKEKENNLIARGYNLITIWESEWTNRK